MVEKSARRQVQILLLLSVCLVVSFQPMALTGSTFWDVSTAWSFYSGTGSNSGPVSFQTDIIATDIHPDGTLVQFTDFSMGTTWANIGFHAPLGGSILVTNVGSNEVRFTATPSGAGLETFKVYVAGKGSPGSVSGGVDWSFLATDQVVSVRSDVTDSIVLSWAALPPSGPGGESGGGSDIPGPVIPELPGAITPAINWWAERGSVLIAVLVIGVVVYNQVKESSSSQKTKEAYSRLLPSGKVDLTFPTAEGIEDSLKNFAKKLKEDVWD